ncbi:hypothetical protein GO013_01765 [Pseudodesulfovibrio sp. JC047]|uniref:hypothetical protein n=1 Tax=Pseudodesulfovibrio sp. JC047 TaxID=2683199 RepID=UPI0013D22C7E|nr:hypothetical protein [Pseudodesulfovibrio sp. JC047]NDV18145.1 hypothetical protein [Pseudodesulfovibrio sp. JC047]
MTVLEREDLQNLLVRIDERVKAIQEDIREINESRRCATNQIKIRTLERLVWGCLATVGALGARMLLEVVR